MRAIDTDRDVDWGVVQRLDNGECSWISVQELAERLVVEPEDWLAGRISRDLAEEYVLHSHLPCGTFLIRESQMYTSGKFYALTVKDEDGCSGSKVKHYRIEKEDSDESFTIIIKPIRIKFKTLENLVHYFRNHTGLLCCKLTFPALRSELFPTALPQRSSSAAQNGDQSCSELTSTSNTSTEMEVKRAVQSAMETVRAPLRATLSCTICCQVSREPTLCISCGHLIGCYICVLTALEHDERCPLCRTAWNRSKLTGFIKSRLSFEKVLQENRNENPKP